MKITQRFQNIKIIVPLVLVLVIGAAAYYGMQARTVPQPNQSQEEASSSSVPRATDKASIAAVGITNYDTVPEDLKTFLQDDYEAFLKQCYGDQGAAEAPGSYTVVRLVREDFSVVETTEKCKGALKTYGKVNNKWQLLFETKVDKPFPACTDTDKYKVSKLVFPECLTASGGSRNVTYQ